VSLEAETGIPLFEQKRLTRARFLRMLGSGVGISLVPGSLAGLGGVASAQTTWVPTILAGPEYPIGIWWPPPPSQTTTQRYQEIAAAGFNFVIGGNGVINDTYNPTALKAAGDNNLRYVLRDSKLSMYIRDKSSSSVSTRIDELLKRHGGYKALTGLYLYDEPHKGRFGIIGHAKKYLKRKNSNYLPWVNLYGYTKDPSLTGVSIYEKYLRLYLNRNAAYNKDGSNVVLPPFLSFDHYPLVEDTAITAIYFKNWALVRAYSRQAGIPSWGFIQSVDFKWNNNSYWPRRRPNEAELFWQVNVALAYGAKGLQYFTYWTPQDDEYVTFGEALVTEAGNPTPLHGYATNVNKDYLSVVGKVLLPLKSESVVHALEDSLPSGTTAFSDDGYVNTVSVRDPLNPATPVILGSFSNPAVGTERYLLVVNRSFSKQASNVKLTLNTSVVSDVSALDIGTGTFGSVKAGEYEGGVHTPDFPGGLAAGRARLYRLKLQSS
jgi:hypothetical protein